MPGIPGTAPGTDGPRSRAVTGHMDSGESATWASPRPQGVGASPGVVHDGVEPVGNGEHGAVVKLRPDGGLNEVVRLQVHGRCGLVQHQDLRLPQQSPRQAHKLALPDT